MSASRCDYWFDEGVRYALTVETEPTQEPVTEAEARDHCRIDIRDSDPWLTTSIAAARRLCETYTKRCFIDQRLRLSLDAFPATDFWLPRPPLISVVSLKYLDTNGTQQTLATNQYSVDTYSEPGRITPAYNVSWPNHRVFTNSIEVLYRAGYSSPENVPENVKLAILVAVDCWNEDREGKQALPEQSKALLATASWGFLP